MLDFAWDWTRWLTGGDTITDHTITADDGITVDSHTATGQVVTAWLSGGTAGQTYSLVCSITTAQGRTDERTMQVSVRDM